ncbi:ROK family transcriptional regulator [Paenibacillus sp. J5C_2022]|uniref:ROK family transcriptional regulator n=1 Tax=Paenibacillus sp. J5C2022 TaxID=2977129 RepID=UPI0021D221C0|nr:ROK family transcriptional regulator [Paenibacillus sp. J5C2022]MCU6712843.1 ROK family transcriptional regulator [Paenibacillus sp. J5C2022]
MAKSTGDPALIKKINTSIVLECILQFAPLSRAAIAQKTGLNKATVSSLVQDLIDRHLVLEVGAGASSGGRKPVMLIFNGKAGFAIGIDVGVNYLRGILTDLEGKVLQHVHHSMPDSRQDSVFKAISNCIDQFKQQAPDSPYGIIGIGVGVPGIVNEEGTVVFAPNMGWRQVELKHALEKLYQLPVMIDNEANAGALGEHNYGAGRSYRNQIYVSVGIGIGTGIILDSELYKGSSGFSGELGHLSIQFDGKSCSCGNQGCWELYASENALLEAGAAYGYHDIHAMLQAAEQNKPHIRELFHDIGTYLGIGIANIANIFNPEAVIVGNRMSLAEEWIRPAIEQAVSRRTLRFHHRQLLIHFAELGEQSAVRGAAYCAIKAFWIEVKSGH